MDNELELTEVVTDKNAISEKSARPQSQNTKQIESQKFFEYAPVEHSEHLSQTSKQTPHSEKSQPLQDNNLKEIIAQLNIKLEQSEQAFVSHTHVSYENYEKRISFLENEMSQVHSRVQNSVLQRVAQMLTDNIYDIIPGYGTLTDTVQDVCQKLQQQEQVQQEQLKKQTLVNQQLQEIIEANIKINDDLDYMRQRFGPAFVLKIEDTLKLVDSLKYDVAVFRMHTQSYAMRKDVDAIETKLNTMTPKHQFLDLARRCDDYALNFEMTKTNESLKKLANSLSSYCLQSDLTNAVEMCRHALQDQLDMKINTTVSQARSQSIEDSLNFHVGRTQEQFKVIAQFKDQIEQTIARFQGIINETKDDCDRKMGLEEGRALWANFTKFAVYDDLKDLYKRCLPAIASQEEKIVTLRNELEQMNQVVLRFDELLTQKCSKKQFQDFKTETLKDFLQRKEIFAFKEESAQFFKEVDERATLMENVVKNQTTNFERLMFTNIRRFFGQLQSQKTSSSNQVDVQEVTEQVRQFVKAKAEQEDVKALGHLKANKIDTDICLRWVDLLHRMVKSIIQIYSMHLQGDINMTGYETFNQKQNRKVHLLHQALVVSKWIDSFDSQNVADFFGYDDVKKQDPLAIQKVTQQFKTALMEIESNQLSPNLPTLNEALITAKTKHDENIFNKTFSGRAHSTLSPSLQNGKEIVLMQASKGKTYRENQTGKLNVTSIRLNQKSSSTKIRLQNHDSVPNKVKGNHGINLTSAIHSSLGVSDTNKNQQSGSNNRKELEDLAVSSIRSQSTMLDKGNYSIQDRLNFPNIQPFYKNV